MPEPVLSVQDLTVEFKTEDGSSTPSRACRFETRFRPLDARTPRNLFARIATQLLALAACISLNHELRRPRSAIVGHTA